MIFREGGGGEGGVLALIQLLPNKWAEVNVSNYTESVFNNPNVLGDKYILSVLFTALLICNFTT